MMKILLTGFEAFGTVEENPSQVIVQQMATSNNLPDHIELICEILPVEYEASGACIRNLIEQHQPDAIVMTGVAASRKAISVEFWARNNRTAKIPDNSGILLKDQPINSDEPLSHFLPATLPVFSIYSQLNKVGIPVERSNNAGGYICNNVFYCAVDYLKTIQNDIPAGFIHIPTFSAISQDNMLKAYHEIIETIASRGKTGDQEADWYMTPAIEDALADLISLLPEKPDWCSLVRVGGHIVGNMGKPIAKLEQHGYIISALDGLLQRTSHDMNNGDFSYSIMGGEQGTLIVLRLTKTYLVALNWDTVDLLPETIELLKKSSQPLITLLT